MRFDQLKVVKDAHRARIFFLLLGTCLVLFGINLALTAGSFSLDHSERLFQTNLNYGDLTFPGGQYQIKVWSDQPFKFSTKEVVLEGKEITDTRLWPGDWKSPKYYLVDGVNITGPNKIYLLEGGEPVIGVTNEQRIVVGQVISSLIYIKTFLWLVFGAFFVYFLYWCLKMWR